MKTKTKNNKKPDFRTESLELTMKKGSEVNKDELIIMTKKDNEDFITNDGRLILYQNEKIQISSIGFQRVVNKDNKLMFAYQFKPLEGVCIVHIPDDTTEQDFDTIMGMLQALTNKMEQDGIELQLVSSKEYILPICEEMGTCINLYNMTDKEFKEMKKEMETNNKKASEEKIK